MLSSLVKRDKEIILELDQKDLLVMDLETQGGYLSTMLFNLCSEAIMTEALTD